MGSGYHTLNGSQRQPLPGVRDGSFSPDGAKLAYSLIDGGILIRDLTTGEDLPLPGTALGDFNPVWSPDGAQIVFNRGMGIFDLFIVNLDGSNLRQITHGGVQEWPVGWLPDGGFLYTVPGREYEYIVYRLDLASGESQVFSNENIQSSRRMASMWPSPILPSASAGRWISAAWTARTAGRWPTMACGS